jgi:hypothetical protein
MRKAKDILKELPENLAKALPGEVLAIVAFGEGFIKENISNISPNLLPIYGISIIILASIISFILKFFIAQNKKVLFATIVGCQALCYSLVIVAVYIFSGQGLLFAIFYGTLIGLGLSAVATCLAFTI